MEENESCNVRDLDHKRKFRSQRFSKVSRKRHLQSLALKKVLRNNAENKDKDDCVLHQEASCSKSNSVEDQQRQQEVAALSTPSGIQRETYEPTPKRSRSECKLKPFHQEVNLDSDESEYCIIDMTILQEMIEKSCICKICKKGSVLVGTKGKFAVVDKLNLECSNLECKTRNIFFTSKRSNPERKASSQGPKPFALNVRFVLGMRVIGKGHKALNLFCGFINVSDGMCQESFDNLQDLIEEMALDVSQESMKNTATDVRRASDVANEVVDTTCMFDGTWQRRGYSSLVGAVACLSAVNNQVIDIEIMRNTCKVCQRLSKMDPTTEKYQNIKEKHKCQRNHEGSAPGMELTGVTRIYG